MSKRTLCTNGQCGTVNRSRTRAFKKAPFKLNRTGKLSQALRQLILRHMANGRCATLPLETNPSAAAMIIGLENQFDIGAIE